MAKKSVECYVCTHCGHQESKWLGRCPSCGEWNCLTLSSGTKLQNAGETIALPPGKKVRKLSEIGLEQVRRWPSGLSELDRVLGGGLVPSSTVLIGGEPGIGKSTLILQSACNSGLSCLYISGEESAAQIAQRASRLGVHSDKLKILEENNLEAIMIALRSNPVSLLVIDSVQTIFSNELGPVPGTVNQVKYATIELSSWARETGGALFLVAHVTKEGSIAGPKVMEHLVDTIIYFEQSATELRILRAIKNRYGSVDEVGLFEMRSDGLSPITDPRQCFLNLGEKSEELPPGTSVTPVFEGSRVLMVEIQALTVPAKNSAARVYSDRIDNQRVSRIAAVLEKQTGIVFSDQDLYVNVAGGLRLTEVSIDLALAMALLSARTGVPLPSSTAYTGELSLSGDIRSVRHLERRLAAAIESGFPELAGPTVNKKDQASLPGLKDLSTVKKAVEGLLSRRAKS